MSFRIHRMMRPHFRSSSNSGVSLPPRLSKRISAAALPHNPPPTILLSRRSDRPILRSIAGLLIVVLGCHSPYKPSYNTPASWVSPHLRALHLRQPFPGQINYLSTAPMHSPLDGESTNVDVAKKRRKCKYFWCIMEFHLIKISIYSYPIDCLCQTTCCCSFPSSLTQTQPLEYAAINPSLRPWNWCRK